MDKCEKDPDGYGPDDIVAKLRRYIDSGRNGIDYTFLYRDKNEEFFSKYIITENDRIDILRKLTTDNYNDIGAKSHKCVHAGMLSILTLWPKQI